MHTPHKVSETIELGFRVRRHRRVSVFELVTAQAVAALQGRNGAVTIAGFEGRSELGLRD
jgi:hypothetical protein